VGARLEKEAPVTPLQRASVELQAACGEHYTVADMEWLRGVLRRALAAERRRIRRALRDSLTVVTLKRDGSSCLAVPEDDALACVTPRQVRAMTGGGSGDEPC
jgi:hypothetical protein